MKVPSLITAILAASSTVRARVVSRQSARSDPCADLVSAIDDASASGLAGVDATLVYDCLTNIPLDPDLALTTLTNVRRFLAFYSAQEYFELMPTPELELQPVNLNSTLDTIASRLSNGEYASNYHFDKDVFALFGSVKDGHVQFSPACYAGVFMFYHDYPLVSVAATPDSLPEIYLAQVAAQGIAPATIGDKVVSINGVPAAQYLEEQSFSHPELSWIDPDARYNQMLAYMVSGRWSMGLFAQRFSYPEEPLTIELESGESINVQWKATYNELRADISNPVLDTDSFYRELCLRPDSEIIAATGGQPEYPTFSPEEEPFWFLIEGLQPGSPGSSVRLHRRQTQTGTGGGNGKNVFPVGADYIRTEGQEIGYYLLNADTAVLMVTGFMPYSGQITVGFEQQFSDYVTEAINYAQTNGATRFIIDFSGNGGGLVGLGQDMARQFFPKSRDIFFGSNMRWNPTLDAMLTRGDELQINSTYFDIGHLKKQTGQDWSSMREMLGPVYRDGDYYTEISIPDEKEQNTESLAFLTMDYSGPQPFDPENVVLITSGMCGSTCAVTAEVFHQAGAKTVAFGGRPREGPMQGVGGVKGSQVLGFDEISTHINYFLGDSVTDLAPEAPEPISLRTAASTINFRNSWRKDDGQHLPIEFLYTPADWKLFYTPKMYSSLEEIHKAAAAVAWGGASDMSGGPYTPVNGADGSGWGSTKKSAAGRPAIVTWSVLALFAGVTAFLL